MSLEKNKAIIRSFYEALNKQDLSSLDDLVAPDYFDHTYQSREGGYLEEKGLKGIKQALTMFYKGFPDWHMTIEDIIAEGDKVWIRIKGTGTHIGEYRGLAPTGKKTTWEAFIIWRIVDDKVVEMLAAVSDELDFLKQLGIIEYKGFPEEVK